VNQEIQPGDLLGGLNEVERKFAPPTLYVSGNISFFESGFRVSIVGSRKATTQGQQRARRLAQLISERNGVVVSGLAIGIDTAAHRGAIDANGRTIAVIGTPLDKNYPRENAELQKHIAQHHLCITQFPSGYPTRPQNFPMRNRVMALISDATVIVEAGETSGSISQGWEALRLGRGLFIANSVIDRRMKWATAMLQHGGQVLSDDNIANFFETLPERYESFGWDAIAV
jgi:DNA processing protein